MYVFLLNLFSADRLQLYLLFLFNYAEEKRQVLEEETKMMLAKAKQAAKMQMEIEKLNTDRFITATPPKVSRFSYKFFFGSESLFFFLKISSFLRSF